MVEISKDYALSLLLPAVQATTEQVGIGRDFLASVLSSQAQAMSHQAAVWTAGGSSTLKVISGDFQPGRAIIVMDGLQLLNRGGDVELVQFPKIAKVEKLQTERRTSTFDRMKNATAGSIVGGGIGAAAGLMSFVRTGPMGAAVGGTIGALLTVGHKYRTCRVTLDDNRKIIAVAANTNWLALLASIPQEPSGFLGRFGLKRK